MTNVVVVVDMETVRMLRRLRPEYVRFDGTQQEHPEYVIRLEPGSLDSEQITTLVEGLRTMLCASISPTIQVEPGVELNHLLNLYGLTLRVQFNREQKDLLTAALMEIVHQKHHFGTRVNAQVTYEGDFIRQVVLQESGHNEHTLLMYLIGYVRDPALPSVLTLGQADPVAPATHYSTLVNVCPREDCYTLAEVLDPITQATGLYFDIDTLVRTPTSY